MKENTVCEINGQQSLAFVALRSTPNITARNFFFYRRFYLQKLLSVKNPTTNMRIDLSITIFVIW